ncbi:hypothetical protein ACL7TT_11255 [Microbulbifer sp. 2304DJ12-6]|uniref:hypothetical protein n=1 Tax=Microbulbifer sp. 2304DJ12-6 TaxID=3233340 RepID=UPI0039B0FA2A
MEHFYATESKLQQSLDKSRANTAYILTIDWAPVINGRLSWQSGNCLLALSVRNLLDNGCAAIPSGRTLHVFGTPYTRVFELSTISAEVRDNF